MDGLIFLLCGSALAFGVYFGGKSPVARLSKGYLPITTIAVILVSASLILLVSLITGDFEPNFFATLATMGLCFASSYIAFLAFAVSSFDDESCYDNILDSLGEAIEELEKHEGHVVSTDLEDRIKAMKEKISR